MLLLDLFNNFAAAGRIKSLQICNSCVKMSISMMEASSPNNMKLAPPSASGGEGCCVNDGR